MKNKNSTPTDKYNAGSESNLYPVLSKVIPIISGLLLLSFIVGAISLNLISKNKSSSSDSTNSESVASDKVKIDYSGTIYDDNIFTIGGTDYCINGKDGIYEITANGKTPLSKQKKINNFVIINDVIYYMTEEQTKNVLTDYGDTVEAKYGSCWKMNLDGSNPVKLADSISCLGIVYANEDSLFLSGHAEGDMPAVGYKLYKYDLNKNELTKIQYSDDKFGEYIDFTFVDGCIYFSGAHSDPQSMPVYSYDIKNDSVKDLGFDAGDIYRLDDSTLLIAKVKPPQINDNKKYPTLLEYKPKTNSSKALAEEDNSNNMWSVSFIDYDANVAYLSRFVVNGEDTCYEHYKYSTTTGLKNLETKNHSSLIAPSENGLLYTDSSEKELILRSNDNSEKTVYTPESDESSINSVGKNVLIVRHFDEQKCKDMFKVIDMPATQ